MSSTEEDRISSLTDNLLHEIMSFMNTKYAVQTCILSKRWDSLWKSLPYLDFDIETFPFEGNPNQEDDSDRDAKKISFRNFISKVLFRRFQINVVKLTVNALSLEPYVEELIGYAVHHNVRQLTVQSEEYTGDFAMPESFYTCKSLTALELVDIESYTLEIPKFLALPALKTLLLDGFSKTQMCFNPLDFSACPNLETLKIRYFKFEDETLFVNAPNVKRLELSWCKRGKVVIDAPRLQSFQFCTVQPVVCSFGDLGSIKDVYFGLCVLYPHQHREYVLDCINTLKEFGCAKSLTLSSGSVEALSKFPSLLDENRLPIPNLKHLKVTLGRQLHKFPVPVCILNFFFKSLTPLRYVKAGQQCSWQVCD